MKCISFIFGTRPEAVKLCPLIQLLKKQKDLKTHVCVTAQHREMLDQVLEVFNIDDLAKSIFYIIFWCF